MKKPSVCSWCFFIALIVLVITACENKPTPEATEAGSNFKGLVVGYAQIGAESAWRVANTDSIVSEAKSRPNIELKFSDAQQKQENQIKALSSFVNQGVDVIILAPIVETGWDNVLEKAKKL